MSDLKVCGPPQGLSNTHVQYGTLPDDKIRYLNKDTLLS